jgi:hypothetical protein
MKERHIINLLDENSYQRLGADELRLVEDHAANCPDCARALAAAKVSRDLLSVVVELPAPQPSPFFQQRVLAAIRENAVTRKPIEAFRRWWQVAYPMVGTMLVLIAALGGLTIFAPSQDTAAAAPEVLYTTDAVIMNNKPLKPMTTEQTLDVIYAGRRETPKK